MVTAAELDIRNKTTICSRVSLKIKTIRITNYYCRP